eukprot:5711596-Prymnesium_polylepis.1
MRALLAPNAAHCLLGRWEPTIAARVLYAWICSSHGLRTVRQRRAQPLSLIHISEPTRRS